MEFENEDLGCIYGVLKSINHSIQGLTEAVSDAGCRVADAVSSLEDVAQEVSDNS